MKRQSLGLGFCGIAAFLFASRYVCAAIYATTLTPRDIDSYAFGRFYGYIGPGTTVAALVSLIVGIVYIIWGEFADRQK